ncbi:Aste57867_22749 [Aphanomyces stellatus]|uniref:Aste57867_22749 protein n=1 Tax=Aphanomyces stellatus TaxID=120398 RepID=A0A485LL11_9STRA|nr:hypothetical protein As57867_022679 [Aphanomyces stellatus]VFT99402.1 Aste57867_22749 [Aphanomyces stellatus]
MGSRSIRIVAKVPAETASLCHWTIRRHLPCMPGSIFRVACTLALLIYNGLGAPIALAPGAKDCAKCLVFSQPGCSGCQLPYVGDGGVSGGVVMGANAPTPAVSVPSPTPAGSVPANGASPATTGQSPQDPATSQMNGQPPLPPTVGMTNNAAGQLLGISGATPFGHGGLGTGFNGPLVGSLKEDSSPREATVVSGDPTMTNGRGLMAGPNHEAANATANVTTLMPVTTMASVADSATTAPPSARSSAAVTALDPIVAAGVTALLASIVAAAMV